MPGRVFSRLKTALLSLVIGICTACASSCSNWKSPMYYDAWDSADSAIVSQMIDDALNPSFASIQEVLLYREDVRTEDSIIKTFLSLPDEVLLSVSKVCINKYGYPTKRDIAEEYFAHKDVYNNLINPTDSVQSIPTANTTATEGPGATIVSEVSYHYVIDTIDGKPVKRLVEERKYESK